MQRHSTEWYAALDAHIDARRTLPLVWGQNDCCTAAADWVLCASGADPMADLRGAVSSALDAARVIESEGGLLAAVTKRMGQPMPGAFAQAGDVVLLTNVGRRVMGVCTGAGIAVPGDDALVFMPITMAEAAWRVG